jgi:hypothetical protein
MVRGQQVTAVKPARAQARKSAAKPAVTDTPMLGNGKICDCVTCGVVIGPDSRALQCEKCDRWKCSDCLGLPLELYTALVGGAGAELQWHCGLCRDDGARDKDDSGDKLDRILELVTAMYNRAEEMERRLDAVEVTLAEKANGSTLGALEERLKSLEEMVRAPGFQNGPPTKDTGDDQQKHQELRRLEWKNSSRNSRTEREENQIS